MAAVAVAALALAGPGLRADTTGPALPRSSPESQGVSSAALLDFVETADREIDAMHSVMILRHGHVIAEGWWAPYAPDIRHTMYSLTKSFTSTAIGLAVSEGLLSIDDPVLKFFPEHAPAEPGEFLKALRVRDLLSMATGHHREPQVAASKEWTKTFLAAPPDHKPGTYFLYNTPASYVLSAILQKVTGTKTVDYLRPRLFAPLGIDDLEWETSPEDVTIGGYGLHLRTESIARFGQLYLQKGQWQGRQILPAAWVEAATSRQVSNGSNPASDWDQGYGYQFWRTRHGAFRGDGAFGQYCLVLPGQDAVVAITSGVKSMQAVLDLVFAKLLPAFTAAPLAPDAAGEAALRKKLAGLALHPVQGKPQPGASVTLGRRFVFPENDERIEWVALQRGGDGTTSLVTRVAGVEQAFAMPHGRWATTRLPERLPALEQMVATSGAWTRDDTFAGTIAYVETPFKTNVRLTFGGDIVIYEREAHVAFGETRRPALVGRAQ
jgi:CubicO group peptidase (beta-lactamase class C family)